MPQSCSKLNQRDVSFIDETLRTSMRIAKRENKLKTQRLRKTLLNERFLDNYFVFHVEKHQEPTSQFRVLSKKDSLASVMSLPVKMHVETHVSNPNMHDDSEYTILEELNKAKNQQMENDMHASTITPSDYCHFVHFPLSNSNTTNMQSNSTQITDCQLLTNLQIYQNIFLLLLHYFPNITFP